MTFGFCNPEMEDRKNIRREKSTLVSSNFRRQDIQQEGQNSCSEFSYGFKFAPHYSPPGPCNAVPVVIRHKSYLQFQHFGKNSVYGVPFAIRLFYILREFLLPV